MAKNQSNILSEITCSRPKNVTNNHDINDINDLPKRKSKKLKHTKNINNKCDINNKHDVNDLPKRKLKRKFNMINEPSKLPSSEIMFDESNGDTVKSKKLKRTTNTNTSIVNIENIGNIENIENTININEQQKSEHIMCIKSTNTSYDILLKHISNMFFEQNVVEQSKMTSEKNSNDNGTNNGNGTTNGNSNNNGNGNNNGNDNDNSNDNDNGNDNSNDNNDDNDKDKNLIGKKILFRDIRKISGTENNNDSDGSSDSDDKCDLYVISYDMPENMDIIIKTDDGNVTCHNKRITEYVGCMSGPVAIYSLTLRSEKKSAIEKICISAIRVAPKNPTLYRYDTNYNCWINSGEIKKRDESTVILNSGVKNFLFDDITSFNNFEHEFIKFGHPYKRNYLFHGKPGTGKTTLISVIAHKFGRNVYIFSFDPKLTDSSFHSAISNISKAKPAILLLEDVDCIFCERQSSTNTSSVSFSAVLNVLDGISRINGLITVITTNHIEKLDKALIRPGRADIMIKFDTISEQQIKDLLKLYSVKLNKKNVNKLYELSNKHELVPATFSAFMFKYRLDSVKDKRNISELLNNSTYVELFKKYLEDISFAITKNKHSSLYT
jgi:hypothetical protein